MLRILDLYCCDVILSPGLLKIEFATRNYFVLSFEKSTRQLLQKDTKSKTDHMYSLRPSFQSSLSSLSNDFEILLLLKRNGRCSFVNREKKSHNHLL